MGGTPTSRPRHAFTRRQLVMIPRAASPGRVAGVALCRPTSMRSAKTQRELAACAAAELHARRETRRVPCHDRRGTRLSGTTRHSVATRAPACLSAGKQRDRSPCRRCPVGMRKVIRALPGLARSPHRRHVATSAIVEGRVCNCHLPSLPVKMACHRKDVQSAVALSARPR